MPAPFRYAATSRRTTPGPMRGWSTRATTAAAQLSGSAPSPAAREEPMPDRQSGLCTVITPSSGTSTAPVTTTTGAVPPSRSSATPRSTSRVPATSTSAFGPPSRVPSPAASRTPATCRATSPTLRPPHHDLARICVTRIGTKRT